MSKIYTGQVLKLIVDCREDITAGSNPQLAVRKPDGTIAVWDGAVENKRYITYTTRVTDLDIKGVYSIQALPGLPSGPVRGETAKFEVFGPFQ